MFGVYLRRPCIFLKPLLPFAHDGRVIVGVDEICMVGQPAHAEDGDHATKHLHYLKIVKMKLEDDE